MRGQTTSVPCRNYDLTGPGPPTISPADGSFVGEDGIYGPNSHSKMSPHRGETSRVTELISDVFPSLFCGSCNCSSSTASSSTSAHSSTSEILWSHPRLRDLPRFRPISTKFVARQNNETSRRNFRLSREQQNRRAGSVGPAWKCDLLAPLSHPAIGKSFRFMLVRGGCSVSLRSLIQSYLPNLISPLSKSHLTRP